MFGDFNAVLDNQLDRTVQAGTSGLPSNFFHYQKDLGLVDVWWLRNNTKRDYTFYSHWRKTHPWIDFILAIKGIVDKLTSLCLGTQSLSDHAPVTVEWNEELTYPKSRILRLNNFLLESSGLANLVENKIGSFFCK